MLGILGSRFFYKPYTKVKQNGAAHRSRKKNIYICRPYSTRKKTTIKIKLEENVKGVTEEDKRVVMTVAVV